MDKPQDQAIILDILDQAFDQNGLSFINVTDFTNITPTDDLKNIGLKKKSKVEEIRSVLTPPSPYRLEKVNRSLFIVRDESDENRIFDQANKLFIINLIKGKLGRTFMDLTKNLPLKSQVLKLVNTLLSTGELQSQIRPSGLAELYLGQPFKEEPKPKIKETTAVISAQIEALKDAYDRIGQGSSFVYIHRLRRFLHWPREEFDAIFYQLMKDGIIASHPGDPGKLTSDEVIDSFQDKFGTLFLSMSWRKPL